MIIKKSKLILFFISSTLIFSSCNNLISVEKRKYGKGFYVNSIRKSKEANSTSVSPVNPKNNFESIQYLKNNIVIDSSEQNINDEKKIYLCKKENLLLGKQKHKITDIASKIKAHQFPKLFSLNQPQDSTVTTKKEKVINTRRLGFIAKCCLLIPFLFPLALILGWICVRQCKKQNTHAGWNNAMTAVLGSLLIAIAIAMFCIWLVFDLSLTLALGIGLLILFIFTILMLKYTDGPFNEPY